MTLSLVPSTTPSTIPPPPPGIKSSSLQVKVHVYSVDSNERQRELFIQLVYKFSSESLDPWNKSCDLNPWINVFVVSEVLVMYVDREHQKIDLIDGL